MTVRDNRLRRDVQRFYVGFAATLQGLKSIAWHGDGAERAHANGPHEALIFYFAQENKLPRQLGRLYMPTGKHHPIPRRKWYIKPVKMEGAAITVSAHRLVKLTWGSL